MARKVFLSFLGTNAYVPCNYFTKENLKVSNVRFVQEATLTFEKEFDKIYLFTTNDAYKLNWIDNGQSREKYEGLETRIKKLGLWDITQRIEIKNGFNEEEIWDIFNKVYEVIEDDDNIVFDITHALRYQPMLGMVLINYLKVLKNIKVQAIYYGAFESLGQISDVLKMELIDRNAAVLNLNSFSNLQDWTNASDIFVNFGNAKRIIELSESNEQIKLAEEMQNVLRLFSTVRGKEILDGNRFDELKAKITNYKAKIINVPKLRPFIPIIDFMQNSMSEFSRNNLLNGFKSIKFCIDNELIQQAFTLMQEMIISYILAKESENPTKKISRIVLSACFSTKKEDYTTRLSIYEQEDIKKKNEEDRLKDKFYKSQYLSDFGSIYSSLTKYRNDLNHAGMKGDAEDSEAFYKNAIAKYNELVEIVNKIECKPILHKIL